MAFESIINLKQLERRCLMTIDEYVEEARLIDGVEIIDDARYGKAIFIPSKSNSPVLAIAHLDTVVDSDHFFVVNNRSAYGVVNAQLDDRLGAYIILDLLPLFGLDYDILLTEGEEMGQSTAQLFQPTKAYNWMFSFDRRGDDVVMYEYGSKAYEQLLKDYGFRYGIGSLSDICFLNHLLCRGFNFGCGYHGEHSAYCYADLGITERQVSKFVQFFRDEEETLMPFDPEKDGNGRFSNINWNSYYTGGYSRWNDDWDTKALANMTDAEMDDAFERWAQDKDKTNTVSVYPDLADEWEVEQAVRRSGAKTEARRTRAELEAIYPRNPASDLMDGWTSKDWTTWSNLWFRPPEDEEYDY